ncbi:hypothetical protein LSCM1_08013 [Leishmania martiniquensis]|uniref:Kinesin motor domain-containing protein n=1 Tax=Leishmania martiniquensis TaxID=1580590 RepID=A0A836KV17_9TRYP|nr:hypothetical protein LSCM1_08013 [Leishmania martiniquensis]
MPERVHVVVRIRPFIPSDPPDVELNTLVLDPAHVSVGDNRVFRVDRAYMMEDTTERIYAESVAPLIRRFLCGFNASVLAYGQTGTGKTFTVQSLIPLLLRDIMSDDAARSSAAVPPDLGLPTVPMTASPLLYLQYVEVYGETIRDLLEDPLAAVPRRDGEEPGRIRLMTTAPPGARAASPRAPDEDRQCPPMGEREDASWPATGCVLVGAHVASIFTVAQAAKLIALGDARRATGPTNVHQHSSRSHAILTLFHPRYACRLDVVDLAGSERERKTGNVGVRFQESIAINTGLLALGNVMRALARINRAANGKDSERGPGGGHSRAQHVPYRSSRLTRLLQDTLGGCSATVFIACVAPDTHNRDETLRTLQYCSLALRILNEPLQQYERLRRAQSPQCRRDNPSAAAVSPLSLRKGPHADAAGLGGRGEKGEAEESKVAQLQSAYASLQQQCAAQAEVIATMSASYAAAKGRLALCEQELRKDGSVFTQQIRAVQELVCENQRLRRRLAKVSATRQAHATPAATIAATRPLLSAHSPHRPHSLTDGAHCPPLEEMPLPSAQQAGVRAHDGCVGAETLVYASVDHRTGTRPALDIVAPAPGADAVASAESAQSFIRYILGLHGIHAEAEQVESVEGGYRRRGERPPATAAPSLQSSIRKAEAVSAGGPTQAMESMMESNSNGHARLKGARPPLDSAPSRRADPSITSSLRAVDALSEGDRSGREDQVHGRACDTGATQLDSSAMLLLAAEVLRYQKTCAELRNQVQVLQAELDSKQREVALLRLELHEMKELFTA